MTWLEKQVEAYFVSEITKLGGIAYKFSSPAHRGVPDRIVLLPDYIAFVELKTTTGRLSELQKRTIKELQTFRQTAIVLYGREDVDAYITYLKEEIL